MANEYLQIEALFCRKFIFHSHIQHVAALGWCYTPLYLPEKKKVKLRHTDIAYQIKFHIQIIVIIRQALVKFIFHHEKDTNAFGCYLLEKYI